MVGYAKPWFLIVIKCLADIIPGEFKEGYMDVVCLQLVGKTTFAVEQLPVEFIQLFNLE